MRGSIFERYGGFAKIAPLVMSFYDRLLESDRLAPYFEGSDLQRLIDHQTKFVASLMGGPASYSNEVLRQVHARLDIGQEDFDEMIETLCETMQEFDFEPEDIATVIEAFENRRSYIVSHRAGAAQ